MDGVPFDRILIDAPCSATGVIRRHPDIKVLRQAADIDLHAKQQTHLLNALWPLLTVGGRLVYATCSVLPDENQSQIEGLARSHPEARVRDMTTDWGVDTGHGRQILTGETDMDGFFYACIDKTRS